LFPFSLRLEAENGGYLHLSLHPGGRLSLIGLLTSQVFFTIGFRLRKGRFPALAGLCLVAVTGVYGWLAMRFLGPES
jgi:hypothetical protein